MHTSSRSTLRPTRAARNFVLALFVLAAGATGFAEERNLPYVWNAPTLHVLWHDAYRLFPIAAVAMMEREVEELFAANGISVEVHATKPGQHAADFPAPIVNAVLHPVEAVEWNLDPDAMAVAIGAPGESSTIFVFHPGAMRSLGIRDRAPVPREYIELARGMGRIVAHELVHVLTPERGHAEAGLMASRLTTKTLRGREITLDIESRKLARGAIEILASSTRRVAGAPVRESAN